MGEQWQPGLPRILGVAHSRSGRSALSGAEIVAFPSVPTLCRWPRLSAGSEMQYRPLCA